MASLRCALVGCAGERKVLTAFVCLVVGCLSTQAHLEELFIYRSSAFSEHLLSSLFSDACLQLAFVWDMVA
eukprot:6202066-Pleurochrysis_carterae.AAC.3